MNYPNFVFPLKIKEDGNQTKIFCLVRKKYIILTPEEWVRQHVLYLLIHEKQIAPSRIAVERTVIGTNKRFDILIHQRDTGQPLLIIECKSYKVKIGQETFNQVSQYNLQLDVPFLVVTNWQQWIAAEIKKGEQSFTFLNQFPSV